MDKLKVLDLFSGIGGFSLGFERTGGFRTVGFCEIDPYCQRVLRKHWPEVPCYDDIRTVTEVRLGADGIVPDVLCGGFPCQDISIAGKGAGIKGERSGLWSEYARLIGELRPRFVIVENVAALLNRGLGDVLGDLAALGYDAEWHCIPASAVGAPHRRDRIWIVAYPCQSLTGTGRRQQCTNKASDIDRPRLEISRQIQNGTNGHQGRRGIAATDWWATEPDVVRMVHGVPSRAHRIRGLGNAVVPQIPELIGRAILEASKMNGERVWK